MTSIRDAQAAEDYRCQFSVLPAWVLQDIVNYLNLVPSSDLDCHPAAIGPKDLLIKLYTHVHHLRVTHHPAYAQWQAGADMLLLDKDTRALLDQRIFSLTAFRQAEINACF